jgi:hypothetical protein
MATKWKPGDRVQVVDREPTRDDRRTNSYFRHFSGLTGTITSVYNVDEVAVKIDPEAFSDVLASAHKAAVTRMRAKFLDSLGEEQKRKLSKDERRFDANYVLLLQSDDLKKAPPAPKKVAVHVEEDLESFEPTSVAEDAVYDDPAVTSTRKTLAEIEAAEQAELDRRNG